MVYLFSFNKFYNFGNDKYISYVENIDHFMVRPKNINLRWGHLTIWDDISREGESPPPATHPIGCPPQTPHMRRKSPSNSP